MAKTVVCTIVIGDRFEKLFRNYVVASWRHYCDHHGYKLIVFRKLLAHLPGKSTAWQKLLILDQPETRTFERVIWLDADIIIKSGSPPIEVTSGLIGYVQEPTFTKNAAAWYQMFSMAPAKEVVQTGVLCLEPNHAEILRKALHYCETIMYEMPALSRCLSESGLGYHLDPRFNALVGTIMLDYAPRWIVTTKPIKELLWTMRYPPLRRAVREICERNWFIHAAGAKRDLIKASAQLKKLQAEDA
jgi:hypothetical protein